jgi:hypothetical protein
MEIYLSTWTIIFFSKDFKVIKCQNYTNKFDLTRFCPSITDKLIHKIDSRSDWPGTFVYLILRN